jgi:hypothetical protein
MIFAVHAVTNTLTVQIKNITIYAISNAIIWKLDLIQIQ